MEAERLGDGGWMEPASWGCVVVAGHVGRTPFKLGEKVKPLPTLCPLLPINSEGTETRRGCPCCVCVSVYVVYV